MALKPVCKVGSIATGVCSAHTSARNWSGSLIIGSSGITETGVDVATVGDMGWADCGHPFWITAGSSIFIGANGQAIARVGDSVQTTNDNIPVGTGTMTTGSAILMSE